MAPRATERPAFDIQALQPQASRGSSQNEDASTQSGDEDNVTRITIDPNVSRTYSFGDNWIYFPARSVCDPVTSGYGPGTWELPCAPISRPLTVTVQWSNKGGYSYAKFTPELRFVPADERSISRWVILSLHSHRRLRELSAYSILYCGGDDKYVDESLADPTLRAWIDPLHNSVVRRVKHFSGYMVAAGFAEGRGGMGGLDASY